MTFAPDEGFSVTDIAALTSASKQMIHQVFHALKACRLIRYQGRGYAGRNWYRRAGISPPSDETVKLFLSLRREERQA
jgi:hypothetical protein